MIEVPYKTTEHLIEAATRVGAVTSNESRIAESAVVAVVWRTERGGEPSVGRNSMSVIKNHEKDCTFYHKPWLRDYIPEVFGLKVPSMRNRVHTFLVNSPLTRLRELGRAC